MNDGSPSGGRILLAFAAVYLIWGSTYLAIRFAVASIPPFLMAGTRFGVAGALLFGLLRARGAPRPTLRQWGAAALSGGLMILGGNGVLSWSEQYVPSGVAALLVATVPLWFVVFVWTGRDREAPAPVELAGVLLGLVGVGLLVAGSGESGGAGAGGGIALLAALAVVLASASWAVGSLYNRRAPLPGPPLYATAMTMLAGGASLLLVGVALGEPGRLRPAAVSGRSLAALGYLIVFGSIVAFSAYAWLLRVVRPALVGTYAYVNPVVAVVLGWWLAGETLTPRMALGASIVVASVALVQRGRARFGRRGAEARGRASA